MARHASFTLLLLTLVLSGAAEGLRCYTCMAKVNSQDPVGCLAPQENTTIAVCKAGETYCQKKIVKGAGETTVDRRCYDMCTEQSDIHMGFQVFIDVFCCKGALCNAAPQPIPSRHLLWILSAMIVALF